MRRRIEYDKLTLFYEQLAHLLEAGVPLPEALHGLAGDVETQDFGRVLRRLANMIGEGEGLAPALARFPEYFEPCFLPLLERGTLPDTLRDLARLAGLDRDELGAERAKSWGSYILIMLAPLVLLSLLFYYVVPRFRSLYEEMLAGEPLPMLTQTIVQASFFSHSYAPVLALLLLAMLVFALLVMARNPRALGLCLAAQETLRLGPSARHLEQARFCALLAIFTRHGFTLQESLDACAAAARTKACRRRFLAWATRAGAGADLVGIVAGDRKADALLRLGVVDFGSADLAKELEELSVLHEKLSGQPVGAGTGASWQLLRAIPVALLYAAFALTGLGLFMPLMPVIRHCMCNAY